jgi:hypothetical protein
VSDELVAVGLTSEAARTLTDEVKADAERLWRKLNELYERGAHVALGYASWGDYFTTEFGSSRSHGYRLLASGRVLDTIRQSPIGDWLPKNEAQARELAPLLDQPDLLRQAWEAAVAEFATPTADDLADIVRRLVGPIDPASWLNDPTLVGWEPGESKVGGPAKPKPTVFNYERQFVFQDIEKARTLDAALGHIKATQGVMLTEALYLLARDYLDRNT